MIKDNYPSCSNCEHLFIVNKGATYAKCTKTDHEFKLWDENTNSRLCKEYERCDRDTPANVIDRNEFDKAADTKIYEQMRTLVDKEMESRHMLRDKATIDALRRHGYDVIKWHKYPETKPTEEVAYLLTVLYDGDPVIRIAEFEKAKERFVFDESGEDYWVAKDIDLGEAHILAWAEMPMPYGEEEDWKTPFK